MKSAERMQTVTIVRFMFERCLEIISKTLSDTELVASFIGQRTLLTS